MVQSTVRLLSPRGVGLLPFFVVCMSCFGGAGAAQAAGAVAGVVDLCDRAAVAAAQAKGVPLDVLRAISRAETGRTGDSGLEPWPWTVNMEGAGRWFVTLDEARSYVFLHFKNGARSFDIGCFQINYKWHGDAFSSIDDMFDPELNAQYAAQFLIDLFEEFGNWPDAAGAYHSRTPEFAKKYSARFDRIRAGLSGNVEVVANNNKGSRSGSGTGNRNLALSSAPRPLVPGGVFALGSLMPISRHADTGLQPFVMLK